MPGVGEDGTHLRLMWCLVIDSSNDTGDQRSLGVHDLSVILHLLDAEPIDVFTQAVEHVKRCGARGRSGSADRLGGLDLQAPRSLPL